MQHEQNEWTLTGARVAQDPQQAAPATIEIRDGKISDLGEGKSPSRGAQELDLEGCLILPGLINAHDHLEFALFPRLGNGPYPNAKAWAEDIYHPDQSPIREHLAIPKEHRLVWGGLRNLLGGATTVCHHNPWRRAFEVSFPVRVVKCFGWAHSMTFSTDVADRFRSTPPTCPFVVHLGESTGEDGRDEVLRLERLGALSDRTVLVHAVALDKDGWRLVKQRGAGVVWCPSSNLFTLGKTLDTAALTSGVPIGLGTDSPLTAEGGLLEELATARQTSGLGSEALYGMVTDVAARILLLKEKEGHLVRGGAADLIAFRDQGKPPCDSALNLQTRDLELVMVGGEIKLLSDTAAQRIAACEGMHRIAIENEGVFWVAMDVPSLLRETEETLGRKGQGVLLAGKHVTLA